MSIQLIVTLLLLMAANQIIGTGYGSWKSGFNRELFWKGIKKVVFLLVGYGAIALAAHFAADAIPKAEYLSGILLEPIARYFTKICDSLKHLLNEPTAIETAPTEQNPPKSDAASEESLTK